MISKLIIQNGGLGTRWGIAVERMPEKLINQKSGNGEAPAGKLQLAEPMMAKFDVALCRHLGTMSSHTYLQGNPC